MCSLTLNWSIVETKQDYLARTYYDFICASLRRRKQFEAVRCHITPGTALRQLARTQCGSWFCTTDAHDAHVQNGWSDHIPQLIANAFSNGDTEACGASRDYQEIVMCPPCWSRSSKPRASAVDLTICVSHSARSDGFLLKKDGALALLSQRDKPLSVTIHPSLFANTLPNLSKLVSCTQMVLANHGIDCCCRKCGDCLLLLRRTIDDATGGLGVRRHGAIH